MWSVFKSERKFETEFTHSLTFQSSLDRNETEGLQVMAVDKLFSQCSLSVMPSVQAVWNLTEEPKYIEILLFKNYIRNMINECNFPI